jgi:hypothetical protein
VENERHRLLCQVAVQNLISLSCFGEVKRDSPISLVDGKEREMDYCNGTSQLNERGWDGASRVGPPSVQGAA